MAPHGAGVWSGLRPVAKDESMSRAGRLDGSCGCAPGKDPRCGRKRLPCSRRSRGGAARSVPWVRRSRSGAARGVPWVPSVSERRRVGRAVGPSVSGRRGEERAMGPSVSGRRGAERDMVPSVSDRGLTGARHGSVGFPPGPDGARHGSVGNRGGASAAGSTSAGISRVPGRGAGVLRPTTHQRVARRILPRRKPTDPRRPRSNPGDQPDGPCPEPVTALSFRRLPRPALTRALRFRAGARRDPVGALSASDGTMSGSIAGLARLPRASRAGRD